MKKSVLTIIALFFMSAISFAQETTSMESKNNDKPHSQFVGFATTAWNNPDSKYKSFQFQPKYGYHFNSWFALGITFDYAFTSNNDADCKSNMYGINPFIRLKHMCKESSVAPIILFADLGVNYSVTKNKEISSGNSLADGENMYVGARPGIAYVLSNRFSIAAYFGFVGYRHSSTPSSTNNGTGFTLSTNGLGLGLNIHFL